jgi:hypothetical protein
VTIWSDTGIAHHIAPAGDGFFAIVDASNARIDWHLFDTYAGATTDLLGFFQEYRALRQDERSERFGLIRMSAIQAEE